MSARPSIRRNVLLPAMAAVALVWSGTSLFVYFDARHEVDEQLDAHLAQTAALLVAVSGNVTQDMQAAHAPRLDRGARHVAFQVWQGERMLLHSPDAPDEPLAIASAGYSDHTIGKRQWRVFSARAPDDGRIVHVAERSEVRNEIARDMAVNLLSPMLYALPVLAVLLWIAVARGLRPLAAVAGEVSARAPGNLAPLEAAGAPAEVEPLVERINALFAHIERSFESERRFTADAAHELRTPVAAIRAQAQVALAAATDAMRQDALLKVVAGCDRAAHLVDQLLALARLDVVEPGAMEDCPLRALAAQAIAEVAPFALAKGVQLELDDGGETRVRGVPALLHALLRNVIDNAARYSPPHTAVHVAVIARGGAATLEVTDQGPGIAETERERVFQRFYRVLGTGERGTGLGLPIVERIAQLHGARLVLRDGPGGRGLRVSVIFAPAPQAGRA